MSHHPEPVSSSPIGDHAYQLLTSAVVLWVALATMAFRILEDWSWVDSLYFSVVAVTTVGFGDLAPSTDASKLCTIIYVLGGIALIATFLNVSLRRMAQRAAVRRT